MIHAVGYSEEDQELEVIFNSGGVYRYQEVDRSVYENLLNADSKGRFMRSHVIDMYPYYKK